MSLNGIDVSNSNGRIDWKAVASSGIKFAILKAGYGNSVSQKDAQFQNNIKGALDNNIKVGIYWFSYAVSVDDAIKEAEVCNQIIASYKSKITLPIFYDWEYDSAKYFKKVKGYSASNALINQMNVAFINKMKAFGYKSGTYFNGDYKNNILNSTTLNIGYKWIAYYSGAVNSYDFQQTTSSGHVNGISGNVDLDVCYNNNFFMPPIKYATTFKSDTTGEICLQPLGNYTFKITANGMPDFKSGNSILKSEFIKQQGNDYFFKVISNGALGGVGIYIGSTRICVVNIQYLPFKSDTNSEVKIKKGQSYQAKITCIQKPVVNCADNNVFKIEFVKQIGSDWYYKFTAIGNVGKSVGMYINGSKQPTFIGTIII